MSIPMPVDPGLASGIVIPGIGDMSIAPGLASGIDIPDIEAVIVRVQADSTTMLPEAEAAPCAVGVASLEPQAASSATSTSMTTGSIAHRNRPAGAKNLVGNVSPH